MMEIAHSKNLNSNYFNDFSLWNKFHFFAFKYRKQYPNMFFYYFSHDGKLNLDDLNKNEVSKILELKKQYNSKLNGMWGFISTIFNHRNGLTLYKLFSKSEFMANINVPLFQDVTSFCDKEINI